MSNNPLDALKWRSRRVSPHAVQCERRFQPRADGLSDERVNRYKWDMKRGDSFPAIKLAERPEGLYVLDGFHRVEAAKQAGVEAIQADIASMDEDTAVRIAIAANAKHGLPLKGKDKRRCFALYVERDGHLRFDGSVKSLRQIRADLDNIAYPQTISSWLKNAGIVPAPDAGGPNVSWVDEAPRGPDVEEFEIQLHILENMFHRLNEKDRAMAGKQLSEVLERLVADEFLTAELTAMMLKAREQAEEDKRAREMLRSLDI